MALLAELVGVRIVETGWLAGTLRLGVPGMLVKYSCLRLVSGTGQSCIGTGREKQDQSNEFIGINIAATEITT